MDRHARKLRWIRKKGPNLSPEEQNKKERRLLILLIYYNYFVLKLYI